MQAAQDSVLAPDLTSHHGNVLKIFGISIDDAAKKTVVGGKQGFAVLRDLNRFGLIVDDMHSDLNLSGENFAEIRNLFLQGSGDAVEQGHSGPGATGAGTYQANVNVVVFYFDEGHIATVCLQHGTNMIEGGVDCFFTQHLRLHKGPTLGSCNIVLARGSVKARPLFLRSCSGQRFALCAADYIEPG